MIDIEEFIELYNSKLQGKDNINIFELVELFNNRYKDFLLDYSNLKDLGLCEKFNIQRYIKNDEYQTENIELELHNLKYAIHNQDSALGLIYKNSKESGIVLRNIGGINYPEERFREFINLDDSISESYLQLGRKQVDFIDAYHELRSGCPIVSGEARLFSTLYDSEVSGNTTKVLPKYINELNNLTLGLSIFDGREHNFMEFVFGLNDNYGDVKASKCSLGSQEYILDDDSIIHILSSINISRDLLPNMFKQHDKTRKREVK